MIRFLTLIVGTLLFACTNNQDCTIPQREHSIQSVLWQQNAAEYKALTIQAYKLAKMQILKTLEDSSIKKPAVITDIDETVLDNSPFNAKMVELDTPYTKEMWKQWCEKRSAEIIPGAKDFLSLAYKNNVEVFFISNRPADVLQATIDNLKKHSIPNVDSIHVLLKTESSKKGSRRKLVFDNYDVIMLLGDNLSDFNSAFDDKSTAVRNDLINQFHTDFGEKFIVFPNPMYGDWESKGIYQGKYDWSKNEADSLRRSNLRLP